MIDFKLQADKNSVKNTQQDKTILFQIEGVKSKTAKKHKRTALNLSLVIDVSGSMDQLGKGGHKVNKKVLLNDYVDKNYPQQPWAPNPNQPMWPNANPILQQQHWPQPKPLDHGKILYREYEQEFFVRSSKLDQAKKAAKQSISLLKETDFVSIVIFDDNAKVVQESILATEENKPMLYSKIDAIRTAGGTNLHAGWLAGATEVAKKQSTKKVNRVILLTDGEVNVGIKDPTRICQDVSGLYEKGISVSTFGVGESFNEDLLQKMSNVGGGNSYYIENEEALTKMFEDEFLGLSNIAADQVKLSLTLDEGVTVKDALNKFEEKDGKYLLTNIINNQKVNVLFNFSFKVTKKSKIFSLGQAVLEYKDEEGKTKEITIQLDFPVLSEAKWEEEEINEEVKIQETLLVIANNKIAATQYIDKGDLLKAKSLLNDSMVYGQSLRSHDARVTGEINNLSSTLMASASLSDQAFRKDLSYQSYKTRSGKLDN